MDDKARLWVVVADVDDYFQLRDGTSLTDGYELNSPGIAQRRICVTVVCIGTAAGVWAIFDETGGNGTLDPSWVTGLSPD